MGPSSPGEMNKTRRQQVEGRARDALEVAGGAGIVFGAELGGRLLRLAATWYLSGALGPALYGRYASALTLLLVGSALVPLGLDLGIVYFGARYRGAGDAARLKGALGAGLVLSTLSGLATAALCWLAATVWLARQRPALAADLALLAPAVGLFGLLLFSVGVLRAEKDMRAQALSFQLALPAAVLAGAVLAVEGGLGLAGALQAYTAAVLLALLLAGWQCWRRLGPLLRKSSLKARLDLAKLLRWSLPQSLESVLFRANQWMDVLMLTWLAASLEVGTYRVALTLALLCQVPVMAVVTIFNPVVAELVGRGELPRLDRLLRTVTRWLLAIVLPIFLSVILLPDLFLLIFDARYAPGAGPLRVLALGLAVFACTAPSMRLIPMAGFARLNLANHVWVALLNGGLNFLLIPRLGMLGAALATSASLLIWSLAILLQVRQLLGCWAWPWRNAALGALALALGGGAALLGWQASLPLRAGLVLAASAAFWAAFWRWGRGPEDRWIVDRIKGRFARRRTR